MWKIKDLEINSHVVLAPMAGITSSAYRKFMRRFGVGLVYTEMISDHGIVYKNKETLSYLDIEESERPIAIQIFGGDKEYLLKAIKFIDEHHISHDLIDINLACPVPKVTKSGSGSKMLLNLTYLEECMREIVATSKAPVSAKIRLGYDNEHINVLEVCHILEKVGVSLIAIHARTAKELYSGEPHFDLIKDLGEHLKVPLVISGNIFSVEDAIKALNITAAKAVMVARGGVGNPELVSSLNNYFETGEIKYHPNIVRQKKYCLEFAKLLIEEKGEKKAMSILRGIAPKFFFKMPNIKLLRNALTEHLSTYDDLKGILDKFIPDEE